MIMNRKYSLLVAALISMAVLPFAKPASAAQPTVYVYGPGGPLPAMKQAAAAFGKMHNVNVIVTGGPTPAWLNSAKTNGDVIFSGSETMMTTFIEQFGGEIDPASVTPLYLRAAAILVRPGNPDHITGISDLLKPGQHILVVNGSGQQGLWEDVVGRMGDIATVKAFRANITTYADNSAVARTAWEKDKSLNAWLIWTIWQVSNPKLATLVPIESQYAIYRDAGVALTHQGDANPQARAFIQFLQSKQGGEIFAHWGWIVPNVN
jgi:accessory colonization factor AcfC